LIGHPAHSAASELVSGADVAELSPIDDVRGTVEYRSEVALTLVRRAIAEAMYE
jgi:CO/xanthine dehydrogenase FAD-binding subunit